MGKSNEALEITSWLLIGSGIIVFLVAMASMMRAVYIFRQKRDKKQTGTSMQAPLLRSSMHSNHSNGVGGSSGSAMMGGGGQPGMAMSEGVLISLVLKCMLPWAPFFRVVDMLISTLSRGSYLLLSRPWGEQDWLEVLSSSFPGYILVATYLLLVLFWAWLYTQTSRGDTMTQSTGSPHRSFFAGFADVEFFGVSGVLSFWLLCVAAEFLVWILLMMMMAAFPTYLPDIHKGEASYACSLSIVVAILFAVWGIILFNRVQAAHTATRRSRMIANKIFVLTVICTILFVARAITIIISTFILNSFPQNAQNNASFGLTIFWTFGCEFLPTLFMVIILHWSASSAKPNETPQPKPINV